ncbi:MAG: methyltransferase [Bacteroidota bacterium]
MSELNAKYWDNKYLENQTGWDIGYPSTPLKDYIDQLDNKETRVLIPGAGNAYEAEYLLNEGFKYVFVLDFSREALNAFKLRVPEFPIDQIIQSDFFEHDGAYDLILEQTFFCAVDPAMRKELMNKTYELLRPKGKYVGLLFDFPLESGPPFGGSLEEYIDIFQWKYPHFQINRAYNSIKPRKDKEFFFIAQKT